jgi:hypothetical protein
VTPDDGLVHQRLGGVEPHAVEARAEGPRAGEAGADAVVLEIHEGDDAHALGHVLRELQRGADGVAVVRRDEGVGHGADALAAPPRRLRVG